MSELKVYKISGIEFDSQFYLKSEADKEIAHHKYKRCMAMAKWCNARYNEEDAKVNDGLSWEFISPEMKYWERWRWRWEDLSEKFKEVK